MSSSSAEADLVGLPRLPGGLPGRGDLGDGVGGPAPLGLGPLALAVALGGERGQVRRRGGAQLLDGLLRRHLPVERCPQPGALLAHPPAQLLVLGVALLHRGPDGGPGVGQLGAQPFELAGQLVDPGQSLVPLGAQLTASPAAGRERHGVRCRGVGQEHGRRGGRQRVVHRRRQLARPVLVPPGDDGGPERTGRLQFGEQRGAAEPGPLRGCEAGQPAQGDRHVVDRQRADGDGRGLGQPRPHGLGQAAPRGTRAPGGFRAAPRPAGPDRPRGAVAGRRT